VIGCLPMARTDLLPESVVQLLQAFPSARVSIVDGPYDEQLHGLLQGEIDLILGAIRTQVDNRELVQEALFDDPLAIIVRPGHPTLGQQNLSFKDLLRLEWIAPREGTPTRELFRYLFARHGEPEPAALIECSSLIAIRGLLSRSDRASLISLRQVRPEIEANLLAALPMQLPFCSRPIGITTRRDWEPTQLQANYLQTLRQIASGAGNHQ
jgi:DNA-binding transcriptional LysR family regulator